MRGEEGGLGVQRGELSGFHHYTMLLFLLCSMKQIKSTATKCPSLRADKLAALCFLLTALIGKSLPLKEKKTKTIRMETHRAFKCVCRQTAGRLAPDNK